MVFLVSSQEILELQRIRRRNRTATQSRQLELLPNTKSFLEAEINSIIGELGSENFRNLPGASGKLFPVRVSGPQTILNHYLFKIPNLKH